MLRKIFLIFTINFLILLPNIFSQDSPDIQSFNLAQKFFLGKEYKIAASEFEDFLKKYPNSIKYEDALYFLIKSNKMIDNQDKIKIYSSAYMKSYPQGKYFTDIALDYCSIEIERKNYSEAESILLDMLQKYSRWENIYKVYLLLSTIYEKMGQLEKGEEILNKFIENYTDSGNIPEILFKLSDNLLKQKKTDEYLRYLNQILLSYPASQFYSESLVALLDYYMNANNWNKIVEISVNAKTDKLDKNIITKLYYCSAKAYLSLGKSDEAMNQIKKIDKDFYNDDIYYLFGEIYYNKNLNTESLNSFNQIKNKEKFFNAYEYIINIFKKNKLYLKMIIFLEKEKNLFEKKPNYYLDLGDAYYLINDYQMAINYYEYYLKLLNKADEPLYFKLAEIYLDKFNNTLKAEYYLSLLININSENFYYPAIYKLGEMKKNLNDYNEALRYFEIIKNSPNVNEDLKIKAVKQSNKIKFLYTKNYEKAIEKLSKIINNTSLDKSEKDLELLKLYIYDLKDYEKAYNIFINLDKNNEKIKNEYNILKFYLFRGLFITTEKSEYKNVIFNSLDSLFISNSNSDDISKIILESSDLFFNTINEQIKFIENYSNKVNFNNDVYSYLLKLYLQLPNLPEYSKIENLVNIVNNNSLKFEALMRYKNYQKIISLYEANPSSIKGEELYFVAQSYFEMGNYNKSISLLNEYFLSNSSKWLKNSIILMAKLYLKVNDYENANLYKELFTLKYNDLESSINLNISFAQYFINNKKYDEALDILIDIDENNKKYVDEDKVLLNIAYCFELDGDLNNAINYYLRLIKDFPQYKQDSKIQLKIPELYFQMEDYNTALKYYSEFKPFIKDRQTLLENSFGIIRCYFRLAQINKAEAAFTEFEKNNGKIKDYNTRYNVEYLMYYYKIKEYSKMEKIIKNLLKDEQIDQNTKMICSYYRILAKINENDFKEAEKLSLEFLKTYKDNTYTSKIYTKLGNVYYQKDDLMKSLDYYKKADEITPNTPYIIYNIAHINEKLQNYQTARKYYEKYLSFAQQNEKAEIEFKIAYCYFYEKNYIKTIELLNILLEKYPDMSFKLYYYKGETYFNMNKFDNAIREYLKTYHQDKESDWGITSYLKVAKSYIMLDEKNKAIPILQEILNKYGEKSNWGMSAKDMLDKIKQ